MLDTGSCRSHINMPNPENVPSKEFIQNKTHYDKLQIDGIDFGPITFSYLPIKIDAILGVELLINHAVFIDFINHDLYVCKTFSHD